MNDKIEKEVITLKPFKKFCMTIGELPSSYVETMSYYEMLVWFTKYLQDTVIPTINNNGEAVVELQEKFVELKDYVDNYFDSVDFQTMVNAKLDEMATDGTLADLINQEIFGEIQQEIAENKKYQSKVHMICMKNGVAGNCFVVEFANGKKMAIDTGSESQWSHIVSCLNELEITKFDYIVITHPHSDHKGNLQNFITYYSDENTIFYTGATPDLTRIENERQNYEDMEAVFTLNNITPVVPTNNEVITIDELSKTTVRFLNTNTTWFEDYYYPNATAEYYTDRQSANVFSLVTEITFDNVKFSTDISCVISSPEASSLPSSDTISISDSTKKLYNSSNVSLSTSSPFN